MRYRLRSLQGFTVPGLLCIAAVAALAACTGGEDSGSGPLLDLGNVGGSSSLLSVAGPAGEASGELTVDAGSSTAGFLATLRTASGLPVRNAFVTLRPDSGEVMAQKPGGGTTPGGAATNANGQVRFTYTAPDQVTGISTVEIAASARIPNSTPSTADDTLAEDSFELIVVPAAPAELQLTGPADVAPGIENAGFAAAVVRDDGAEVPEACVILAASAGATILPPPGQCEDGRAGYVTDDLGRLAFRLRPPANIAADTVIAITGETRVNAQTARRTLNVTARLDTFQFTAPAANATALVGRENAAPLALQWTRAPGVPGGGSGVGGPLSLSTTRGFFVVNGAEQPAGQAVTVSTTAASGGNFSEEVAIASNTRGQATVTARDAAAGRSASVALQFVDTAGEINLDVQPLVVNCSPNSNRFSTLTVTVLNGAGAAAAGVEVNFLLVTPAGSSVNERVFPQRQTTNDQGIASSRYEAGPNAGTARVQVQVQGGGQSNPRDITIQSPPAGSGAACS